MMEELDLVVLTRAVPQHHLTEGDIGTIVHIYNSNEAFEVEFVAGSGQTIATLTLMRNDIRSIQHSDIVHVRDVALIAA